MAKTIKKFSRPDIQDRNSLGLHNNRHSLVHFITNCSHYNLAQELNIDPGSNVKQNMLDIALYCTLL